jgi:transcriptional regulator with XRE-family HTH domain
VTKSLVSASPDPLVHEVAEVVRRSPGLSKVAVRRHVRARGARVLAAVDGALALGLVYEGPGTCRSRAGHRSARVLYPWPVPAEVSESIDAAELRAERERLGLSQTQLAARMGVAQSLIAHWEAGRQPIASGSVAKVRSALDQGPPPPRPAPPTLAERAALIAPRVLETVSSRPGLTLVELRQACGFGPAVRAAVAEALESGAIHRADVRRAKGASAVGYFPGPAPTRPPAPSPKKMRSARERACWSQEDMAAACGVAVRTYRLWEAGKARVPSWAVVTLVANVERARRRDPMGELVGLVEALVAAEPGITVAELQDRLSPAPAVRTAEAIERARAGRRIHGRKGLHPGPEPTPFQPGELRRLREQAGWTVEEVGEQLGLRSGAPQVSTWERGNRPVPLPRVAQLRQLYALGAPSPIDACKALLVSLVEAGDREGRVVTEEDLTRRGAGRGGLTYRALDACLAEGLFHRAPTVRASARGPRTVVGFLPGPEPRAAGDTLSGAELKARRLASGLSRPQLGALVGVSKTQVGYWEDGKRPLAESWTSRLLDALDRAPAGPPRPAPVRMADAELEQAALAAVAAEPGLTGRQVTTHMRGEITRRWAAIRCLLDAGRLEERPVVVVGPGGGRHHHQGLYLTDQPEPSTDHPR